jgi:hypothetical protein
MRSGKKILRGREPSSPSLASVSSPFPAGQSPLAAATSTLLRPHHSLAALLLSLCPAAAVAAAFPCDCPRLAQMTQSCRCPACLAGVESLQPIPPVPLSAGGAAHPPSAFSPVHPRSPACTMHAAPLPPPSTDPPTPSVRQLPQLCPTSEAPSASGLPAARFATQSDIRPAAHNNGAVHIHSGVLEGWAAPSELTARAPN